MEQFPEKRLYCVIVWDVAHRYQKDDSGKYGRRRVISYRLTMCSNFESLVKRVVYDVKGRRNLYASSISRGVAQSVDEYGVVSFRVCIGEWYEKWRSYRGNPLPIYASRYPTGEYISVYDCNDPAAGHKMLTHAISVLKLAIEAYSATIVAQSDTIEKIAEDMFARMISDGPIVDYTCDAAHIS